MVLFNKLYFFFKHISSRLLHFFCCIKTYRIFHKSSSTNSITTDIDTDYDFSVMDSDSNSSDSNSSDSNSSDSNSSDSSDSSYSSSSDDSTPLCSHNTIPSLSSTTYMDVHDIQDIQHVDCDLYNDEECTPFVFTPLCNIVDTSNNTNTPPIHICRSTAIRKNIFRSTKSSTKL